jgi:hypothetical protein
MPVYKCFELHTHTVHSDGRFTPEALLESARAFQYDGIALTDHNTMSGIAAMDDALIGRTLPVIPGIEWTTYFGHMLVLGAGAYVDWRSALPHTIDEHIKKVKDAGGVVGIAHPFEFGSPMCTGCYWDFKVRNWEPVDYMEIWSEPFPHRRFKNELAFAWWTELLNKGVRLAAAAGRDWHGPEKEGKVLTTATYLGLEDGRVTTAAVREAPRRGRSFVTLGARLDFRIRQDDGREYGLGETLAPGAYEIIAAVDASVRRAIWQDFGINGRELAVVHNGKKAASLPCSGSGRSSLVLDLQSGWVRLELYGTCMGCEGKLLAFTSPLYIA